QVAQNYAVGQFSYAVEAADFNGDGFLDLAVTNSISGTVSILLGNGDGTFQPARDYSVYTAGWAEPFSMAVGDLNGDGIPDLAVIAITNFGTGQGMVSILLGNGDRTGEFSPPGKRKGNDPST